MSKTITLPLDEYEALEVNANKLELNPMVNSNTSSYETAFTVSVDAVDALT